MTDDRDAAERAARRASWPVRLGTLQNPPRDDLTESTTVEERVLMVWPLTLEAWAFAGLPIPDYRREESPVVIYRRGEERPDD